jgi:glycosyltransferase involved in cell wall biosynthesis
MARYILDGMRRAALVFYSTDVVREELLATGLLPAERLVHAPYGTAPEFTPEQNGQDAGVRARLRGPFLLHVGSCIPRKNTAFLLRLLARLQEQRPELRLLQVGGTWPEDQRALLAQLGLQDAVLQLRDVPRSELAAMYRQAEAVILPSHAEGFGLPVIEALACGTRVVATDLAVFREVGGDAVEYAASGELDVWTQALCRLSSLDSAEVRARCARRAARYSWHEHARRIIEAYRGLDTSAARGNA